MDPRYYRVTQIANVIIPILGFVLSIPGLVALIVQAAHYGSGIHVLTVTIFGCSLLISYATFSLYHVFKFHERWGRVFKILDHSTIYLLIAGTYTPLTLILLRGHWGWTLFAFAWGMAVIGVFGKIFFMAKFKLIGPLIYLFMGWMCLLIIKPAMALIPAQGLLLLLAGGLFYSSGLIFYLWKKLHFHHAIWHLFVLAGSLCHYFAVYSYIISPV